MMKCCPEVAQWRRPEIDEVDVVDVDDVTFYFLPSFEFDQRGTGEDERGLLIGRWVTVGGAVTSRHRLLLQSRKEGQQSWKELHRSLKISFEEVNQSTVVDASKPLKLESDLIEIKVNRIKAAHRPSE